MIPTVSAIDREHDVLVKLIHLGDAVDGYQREGIEPSRLLSTDELDRARSIPLPNRAQQWIVSRAVLRSTLGGILHVEPQAITFQVNEFGKPRLCERSLPHVGPFWFNYAHSGQFAALAYSGKGDVGIDLEMIQPIKRLEQKAHLFLSELEQHELFAEAQADRDRTFLQLWVLKEALAKALGGGLQNRTRSLQVSRLPRPRVIGLETHAQADEWHVEEIALSGYVGAIAYRLHVDDQRVTSVPQSSLLLADP